MMKDAPSNEEEKTERNIPWEMPTLWTIVEHKSIEHLFQVLQDATDKSEGMLCQI